MISDHTILARENNWRQRDPLPALKPLAGFEAAVAADVELLARLHEVAPGEIQRRFDEGNRCYVAYLGGEPVGYGWVATKVGRIEEAGLSWPLGPRDRHLWDFVTLPAYRGRGVYPHLLQVILRAESKEAGHFWIGHRGDNLASQRGILKAGFKRHWQFVLTAAGGLDHQPQGDRVRVEADPRWGMMQALFENVKPEMVAQIREQFGV